MRPAGLHQVGVHRADDAAIVDPLVLVEAVVLGGYESLLHDDRNVLDSDPDALVLLGKIGEVLAGGIEHAIGSGIRGALEARRVRQRIDEGVVVELDHLFELDRRVRDVFVLAELAVENDDAVEFQSFESHGLGRHRCAGGIIHRRADQVIEVKRLDAECLAHVTAAVAQNLRHFGLVTHRIEFRLDVIGPR